MYGDVSVCVDDGGVTSEFEGFCDDTDGLADEFLAERRVDAGCWFLHRRVQRVVDASFKMQVQVSRVSSRAGSGL